MKLDPDGKVRPKLNCWSPSQSRTFFDAHWEFTDLGYESLCWKWTGCVDASGYGIIKFKGKNCPAHRYSAIIHHGEPPSPKSLACHSCDHPICVNPNHIYWGTHNQNMRDMIERGRSVHAKGEASSRAVLNTEKVKEIRVLRAARLPFRRIAAMMGVSKSAVQAIIYGETWGHVK